MSKKVFFVLLSLLLLGPSPRSWADDPPAVGEISEKPVLEENTEAQTQDHMLSGSQFVKGKKFKEAVREFQIATGLAPDNAEANRLLGLSLAQTGDLDKAAEYSLKAAQLKPNYGTYYLLGLIYANQSKYDRSVEAYEQALKLNPKSYEAWHQLAKVHTTMVRFDKAVEAYQKATELNPKFPDAFQGLGSAYYWSENLTAALQQVDALNKLGFADKAAELERWIKDKEAKKKKSIKKNSLAPEPVPAPAK